MQNLRLEIWVALAAALMLALFGLGVLTVIANHQPSNTAQVIVIQPGDRELAVTEAAATGPSGPAVTRTFLPYVTLAGMPSPLPAQPTATLAPATPTPPPFTLQSAAGKFSIGQSVQGRDIVGDGFPGAGDPPQALVLVSGIHGDETNAWPVQIGRAHV